MVLAPLELGALEKIARVALILDFIEFSLYTIDMETTTSMIYSNAPHDKV